MQRRIRLYVAAFVVLLLSDTVINKINGCVSTVPVDSVEQQTTVVSQRSTPRATAIPIPAAMPTTTLATPTTAPTQCPSCGTDCATVTLCGLNQATDWFNPATDPAASRPVGDCEDFTATDDFLTAQNTPAKNVGSLTCGGTSPTPATACISGFFNGFQPGNWEATGINDATDQLEFVSYCVPAANPAECMVVLDNSMDLTPEITITSQNMPGVQYTQPSFGTDFSTMNGPNYFVVTDICCGTCAACQAQSCNPS